MHVDIRLLISFNYIEDLFCNRTRKFSFIKYKSFSYINNKSKKYTIKLC